MIKKKCRPIQMNGLFEQLKHNPDINLIIFLQLLFLLCAVCLQAILALHYFPIFVALSNFFVFSLSLLNHVSVNFFKFLREIIRFLPYECLIFETFFLHYVPCLFLCPFVFSKNSSFAHMFSPLYPQHATVEPDL